MLHRLYVRDLIMTAFVHPSTDNAFRQPGTPTDLQVSLNG